MKLEAYLKLALGPLRGVRFILTTGGKAVTETKAEPAAPTEAALAEMGAGLMPRPLYWIVAGSSPAAEAGGIPPYTAIYEAQVADGALRCIPYQLPNGWILEVAHVLAGILGPDGYPRAGRIPHLWELRDARARFIPDGALMGLAFLPPAMPQGRPPNCILLAQMGEVRPKNPGLFTPQ